MIGNLMHVWYQSSFGIEYAVLVFGTMLLMVVVVDDWDKRNNR